MSDPNCRIIIMDVNVNGGEFVIVNVYAPCVSKPKEQVEFLNQLSSQISNIDNVFGKKYCRGDKNFLMNIGLDRVGGNPSHDDNVLYTWRQKKKSIDPK